MKKPYWCPSRWAGSDIAAVISMWGKIFDPVECESRQFYELLMSKKTMVSRGFTKPKEDFDLDDMTVSKAFLNLKTVSCENFH